MTKPATARRNGDRGNRARLRRVGLSSILTLILAAAALTGSVPRPGASADLDPGGAWLYLRGGQALADAEDPVQLLAVGDLMLGREMTSIWRVFAQVAPELRAADLVLGNFEGALSITGDDLEKTPSDPAYEPYRLLVPPSAPRSLRQAGFDLVSLANNHTLDAGESGYAATRQALENAGITVLGADLDPDGVPRFSLRRLNNISLAFLAFNQIPLPPPPSGAPPSEAPPSGAPPSGAPPSGAPPSGAPPLGAHPRGAYSAALYTIPDIETLTTAVRRARAQADVVIVLLHWGVEYRLWASPAQRELAQALFEAGADIVLGHHPHVVQEIEVIPSGDGVQPGRDRLAAYSLGNFAFDQGQDETGQGLALRIYLDPHGLRAVQALPVWSALRPRWMAAAEAGALLSRIGPPPPRLGFACPDGVCTPASVPQAEASGLFWSGQIDLTGDGLPEKIRRVNESVEIYQSAELVWRSPPGWQVLDLAAGDPNDDGRAELVLAVNQRSPAGVLTSHPFIISYRGGMYRQLWGGSPVQNPILELELGDLTGDGRQELVVLEQSPNGEACPDKSTAITVWRWHGWGFSQIWRSPTGSYRDLVLTTSGRDEGELISLSTTP